MATALNAAKNPLNNSTAAKHNNILSLINAGYSPADARAIVANGGSTIPYATPSSGLENNLVAAANKITNVTGNGTGSSTSAKDKNAIDFYQQLYDALGGVEATARGKVDDVYNQKLTALTNDRNAAYANLDNDQTKLDSGRTKAQNQLAEDIRNLLQSASTQIGMAGAGNSSANQMAAYGAADLQNSESGNINDDYNEQTSDINLNRDQYKKKFDDQKNELDVYKKGAYTDIQTDIGEQRSDLQNKINGLSPTIDEAYKTRQNQIVERYKQGAPAVSLSDIPQYQAAGISTANVAGQVQGPQLSTEQAMQYLSPTKKDDKKTSVAY